MTSFEIGETVICSIEVKDENGDLQDAATSMNIVIDRLSPNYSAGIVTSTSMGNDSTGKYHYDFASASKAAGQYRIIYTATDGSRIKIELDTFNLINTA